MRFGTLLKEMGFVTETQVLEALGKKLDLQMVNLEEYEVNVDVVAKVPKQLAEKYNVIALSENDGKLQLAMSGSAELLCPGGYPPDRGYAAGGAAE